MTYNKRICVFLWLVKGGISVVLEMLGHVKLALKCVTERERIERK
uniref:Uncharacterized protein n=1 Tax=Anguilla anguilla TaxID=7936 RepID=A0A0E9VQI6_ANGAN